MVHTIFMTHSKDLSYPHFVTRNSRKREATIIVDPNYPIEKGDTVKSNDFKENTTTPYFHGTVDKIIERRKARGNWKRDRPDFIHISVT